MTDIRSEYDALVKKPIAELRGILQQQSRVIDVSEYRTKDHAATSILINRYGSKKVAAAFN